MSASLFWIDLSRITCVSGHLALEFVIQRDDCIY